MQIVCGGASVCLLLAFALLRVPSSFQCSFTDEEVLGLDFKSKVATVAKVMQPLVHWCVLGAVLLTPESGLMFCFVCSLNDMMSVTGGGSDDEEEGEEEGGSDEE